VTVTSASANEILRFYQISNSMLGMLIFTQGAGYLLTVVTAGWISDRRGKFPLILAGSMFTCLGVGLFGLTRNLHVGFLALALVGIGGGLSIATAMAALADLYSAERKTAMMNWSQSFSAIGSVASPLLIAHLLSLGVNWRLGYYITAAVCSLSVILALITVAQRREKPVLSHDHDTQWRALLFSPLVIAIAIGVLLYGGTESGLGNWLAVYFEKTLMSTAALAASTIAFFWIGISLGRIAAAWLSKHMTDLQLIYASLLLAAAALAALLLVRSPSLAIAFVTVLGFGLGPVWPTMLSRASEAYPRQSGTVLGILVAMGIVGLAIFPPVIGFVGDFVGIHRALWICFGAMLANIAIFSRLRTGEKRT
jgi:MFS transporter, FHS family, L-fucose permease